MRLRALFAGRTYSVDKKEPIKYGIVDERITTQPDVVVLSYVPPVGVKRFIDYSGGYANRSEWEVREGLLLLAGIARQTMNPAIVRLDAVQTERVIPAKAIAEAVLKKSKEIGNKEGEVIETEENIVEVNKLPITIQRFRPCESEAKVEETLRELYITITAGRKRTFFAGPAIIEMLVGEEPWYVTTIPLVVHYIRDNPEALVASGVIDEGGFNAPFIIVRGMTVENLGDTLTHYQNMEWLKAKISGLAGIGGAGLGGLGGGGEETPI